MEIITILAILFSPVIAVSVTLWYENRKAKRQAKLQVFWSIMAQRKSVQPTPNEATSLNMVDLFFGDTPKVIQLWHEYFGLLCQQPVTPVLIENEDRKKTELLSAMASSLGYKHLQQTDIQQFYLPQAHLDQAKLDADIQREVLRVLKNSGSILTTPRQDEQQNN